MNIYIFVRILNYYEVNNITNFSQNYQSPNRNNDDDAFGKLIIPIIKILISND